MDIKKQFATDRNLEIEGIWVPISDGARIKVARMNNPEFNKLFRKLSKPYMTALQTGTLSEDISEEIMLECYAKTVLVDWDGIEENGEQVPYSPEKAKEYLQIDTFRQFVLNIARDFNNFKAEIEAQEVKN